MGRGGQGRGTRSKKKYAPLFPEFVLAKSCNECGVFKQFSDFGVGVSKGKRFLRSECNRCRNKASMAHATSNGWKAARESDRRRQDKSIPSAKNHKREWTGPEIELLLREDLSSREVSEVIGRTFYAVKSARSKARSGKWPRANTAIDGYNVKQE